MAAIFAHSSSGPVPLRTLTLGVLIVSGGTLAALPFRRYQAIPDSSTTPVHATGPTNSALQMGAINPVSDAIFSPPQMADAILPGSILATHVDTDGPGELQQPHSNSLDQITKFAKTERFPDVPLTYEDLMLPIEMPEIVRERFNATAAVKSIQMDKDRLADNEMPRMEPMTTTSADPANSPLFASNPRDDDAVFGRPVKQPGAGQPGAGQPGAGQPGAGQQNPMQANATKQRNPTNKVSSSKKGQPTIAEPTLAAKEMATGSLASTGATRANTTDSPRHENPALLPEPIPQNRLPKVGSPSRPRHWIRQPE